MAPEKVPLDDLFEGASPDEAVLRERLLLMHPVDLADYLPGLSAAHKAALFSILDPDQALEVFKQIPFPTKMQIARRIKPAALAALLGRLQPDVATDIVMNLPRRRQREILSRLPEPARRSVEALIVYPRTTAGGVMTTRVPRARAEDTAGRVLEEIRESEAETIEDVFVVDDAGRLTGVCSLRDLLRAAPQDKIRTIARRVEYRVRPESDQEEVARAVERRGLRSVPVVDSQDRLLGVVNLHDILGVVRQELAEDLLKMAGAQESASHSLEDPLLLRVRGRIPSILVALAIELFLAVVIAKVFRQTLAQLVLLSAFIPVNIAIAGGVALQSSALTVRGLAEGSLVPRRTLALIFSEAQVGALIGLVCGLLAAAVGLLLNLGKQGVEITTLSLSVFTGMLVGITASSITGAGIPLLLHKLGRDPATSSGPLITSFNDLAGTTLYLFVAAILSRL